MVCWSQLVPAHESQLLHFLEYCEPVENSLGALGYHKVQIPEARQDDLDLPWPSVVVYFHRYTHVCANELREKFMS